MEDRRITEFSRMMEVFFDQKGTSSIERMAILFAVIMQHGLDSGLHPDMFRQMVARGVEEYTYTYKTKKGD